MNSLPVVYDPSVASSASSAGRAKTLSAAGIAAANDETAEANAHTARNPLWIMPIGMGVFFALAAAVLALS
jgi:hypothetical protein